MEALANDWRAVHVFAVVVPNAVESAFPENERPFPTVSALTAPELFVERIEDAVPETVRFVVLAAPK